MSLGYPSGCTVTIGKAWLRLRCMNKLLTAAVVFSLNLGVTLAVSCPLALAGPSCLEHPREQWLPEATFKQQLIEQGYRFKVFKVDGNCYAIQGQDKSGQRIEAWFDTQTGELVKLITH